MNSLEKFSGLLNHKTIDGWRNHVFKFGREFGFEQACLAILPDPNAPVEAEYAFQQSNYAPEWLNKYIAEQLHLIDPTFQHCLRKSIPQIWSPRIFSEGKPKELYEEACSFGLKSGVSLPIHGAKGEMGLLCLVSDSRPDNRFQQHATHYLSELSCLRDYVFESSLRYIHQMHLENDGIQLTDRELECLKWGARGKNSWEIGYILNCTEATVNFHFGNIRRKFNTKSRQQAIVRAINLGIINPS